MAINKQPIARKSRSLGISPVVMGYAKKNQGRDSEKDSTANRRKKVSEYGLQLKEKQKVKFIYGVLEKQFRKYFERAAHMKGVTGENMMMLLELRLDNAVYRLGLAKTRRMARQMVSHGHILVNGKKVDIPSYTLKVGDVITVRAKSVDKFNNKETGTAMFKALREGGTVVTPKWLSFDAPNLKGTVNALPTREDIDFELHENMIVEYYSR